MVASRIRPCGQNVSSGSQAEVKMFHVNVRFAPRAEVALVTLNFYGVNAALPAGSTNQQ